MNRFIMATGLAGALVAALASGRAGAAGIAETVPGQEPPGLVLTGPSRIEVVFVLDTTGSMSGLIEGAKKKIWAIADEIRKTNPNADLRIGLVGYRDRGDVYVTTKTELSNDIHAVYGQLIQFQAGGGGDWPESVNEALHVAVTKMGWSETGESRRIVFLVGDAPPHMDYAQDIPFTDTLKIAEREHILVNAVQAGNARDTAIVWRTIAQLGHGRYIPIPQSGGVAVIETPYDQQIYQIQIQLNATVIPYGAPARQSEVKGKLELNRAAAPSAASDMASYASRGVKSADRKVVTGEGDLVADLQAKRVEIETVKTEDLPADLRAVAAPERRKVVEAKAAERERLQAQLQDLVRQRDAHLETERKKGGGAKDGFDEVVSNLVREQIR
ncbi:vWA domain-containing protein [Prosthecomicrobium hirschii]|uniref:VWFA domain-containing protein n=1 Tax=Prosthecodimorpha hirschii TaxID=665126 RepID=A0A0P6VU74_9HYPH|nr:vWA domain-containing protein [Prosthecomicrobium hirschii]KPL55093.1 hypothetical protein ABB55_25070 [Prosthecomicrobium hirschii]MCW1839975.1 VWA domain-containing protein [Prosthecomicrobium hirschii]